MLNAAELRGRRRAAGISGVAVGRLVGFSKSKLSAIEREDVAAAPEDLKRIHNAIEQIIINRERIAKLAVAAGLDLGEVRPHLEAISKIAQYGAGGRS